ncbi:MAG: hypothetical protein GY898_09335 [Proteobacteria bacterium]|nr:hypothetical protein [Pseudomonadota bacterium]
MRLAPLLIAACVVACSGGAYPESETPDGDPSLATNACLEVSLVDGLDVETPGELRALFDCLNLTGGFDGFEPLVEALETSPTRTGTVASLEAAELINRLAADADVVEQLRDATYLLQQHDVFLLHSVHTVAEWSHGRPWAEVEAAYADGGGAFAAPDAVEAGMIQPLLPVTSTLAGAILDLDRTDDVAEVLGTLGAMPELADALDTWGYLVAEQEAGVFDHLASDWGSYFAAAQTADGGDTIVPLLQAVVTPRASLQGEAPLTAMVEPLDAILDDPVIRDRFVAAFGGLYVDGTLEPLAAQVKSLVEVDVYGVPITPADDRTSALEALLLLLDEAHAPVSCGLLEVDDLAIWLLETIAGWNPDTVEASLLLTEGLVQFVLSLASVACDGVHPDLDEHVRALVPLAESGALHTMIPLLDGLRVPLDSDHNRIPDAADLLVVPARGELLEPLATHAREVVDEPGLGRALVVVGAYVVPNDPAVADVDVLLEIVDVLLSPTTGEGAPSSPLGRLAEPIRRTLAEHDATLSDWLLRWAVLLAAEGSESNTFAHHVSPLLAIDPDLDVVAIAGRYAGDPELLGVLLRVLDTPEVIAAAGATTTPTGEPATLGLIARMASDGSFEAVLRVLSWTADTLDAVGLLPAPSSEEN